MNIFRFFDRKPHTTAPVELPVPERFQQTLKARSSQKFQVEAKTLDEYRQRSWAEDESANLSSHLESLRSLRRNISLLKRQNEGLLGRRRSQQEILFVRESRSPQGRASGQAADPLLSSPTASDVGSRREASREARQL